MTFLSSDFGILAILSKAPFPVSPEQPPGIEQSFLRTSSENNQNLVINDKIFCNFAIVILNQEKMRHIFILILLSLLFGACDHRNTWVETEEGLLFWGLKDSEHTYSWNGASVGPLIHGEGTLLVYNENNIVMKKLEEKAMCGIIDSTLSYTHLPYGLYLGKLSDDNVPDGDGVLIPYKDRNNELSSDTIIYGHFSAGLLDGKNNKIYVNNFPLYEGGMKKGKYDGTGTLYDSNHTLRYTGEWKDGQYNGQGTFFDENNELRYYGHWKNGQRDGAGFSWNGQLTKDYWKNGERTSLALFRRLFESITSLWQKNDTLKYTFNNESLTKNKLSNTLKSELPLMLFPHLQRQLNRQFSLLNSWTIVTRSLFSINDSLRKKQWEKALFENIPQSINSWANHKIYNYNYPKNPSIRHNVLLQAVHVPEEVQVKMNGKAITIPEESPLKLSPSVYDQLKSREDQECLAIIGLLVFACTIIAGIVYSSRTNKQYNTPKWTFMAIPVMLLNAAILHIYLSSTTDQLTVMAVNQVTRQNVIQQNLEASPIYDLTDINVNAPVYCVQLYMVRNRKSVSMIDFSKYGKVTCLMDYDSNGQPLYNYLLGGANSFRKMEALRQQIRSDFPDAFIVTFKGNRKVMPH